MASLSLEAQELARATRLALKPSADDRARVFEALLLKLGGGPLGAGPRAPEAARGILVKATAVLVGLGVAGGALHLASRPEPESPKTRVIPPHQPAAASPPAPVEDLSDKTVPEPPLAEVPPKRAPLRVRTTDNLAQEVAILSQASSDLHAGRPVDALKALEEHQRRFPTGALAEERTAARIRALCALGRVNEAQTDLTMLSRSIPDSPHLARARKVCGLAQTGEGS